MKPEADGYVPFGQRLAAWWHGAAVGPRLVREKDERSQVDIAVEDEPVELSRWSSQGIDISQRLWGHGFSEPGGAAFWQEIILPAGPNGAMTILAINPGLGGGVRHMVKKLDLWLNAIEEQPELLEAASALNAEAGLQRRISLKLADFGALELPESTHDLIFAREAFFHVAEKQHLLARTLGALKPGGHLVFSDLVVDPEHADMPQIQAWREAEPGAALAWSEAQYRQGLNDVTGTELHVVMDDSERYNEFIRQGWQALQESLDSAATSRSFVNLLMREGKIWLTRSRALQAGQLRLIRFHARRKKLRRTSQR